VEARKKNLPLPKYQFKLNYDLNRGNVVEEVKEEKAEDEKEEVLFDFYNQ